MNSGNPHVGRLDYTNKSCPLKNKGKDNKDDGVSDGVNVDSIEEDETTDLDNDMLELRESSSLQIISKVIAPTIYEQIHNYVNGDKETKTANAMLVQSTPQYKAFEWIVRQDEKSPTSQEDTFISRYVLVLLYFAMEGSDWTIQPRWVSDGTSLDVCDWMFVSCNDNINITSNSANMNTIVTALNIPTNNLGGSIPSEIQHLSNLRMIDMSDNIRISGTIPSELYNLVSLEVLGLGGNDLVGTVSTLIGRLSNLRALYLRENGLDGALPLESPTSNNVMLTELDVSGTYFENTFKSILETFPNLGKSSLSRYY